MRLKRAMRRGVPDFGLDFFGHVGAQHRKTPFQFFCLKSKRIRLRRTQIQQQMHLKRARRQFGPMHESCSYLFDFTVCQDRVYEPIFFV